MRLPNYTQTPNDFIDSHMKGLSGAAAKIFLTICRKTIGWHKVSDAISYSQLAEITGLGSEAISKGLKELKAKDLIGIYPRGERKTPYYDINFMEEAEKTTSIIEADYFDNRSTTTSIIEETKEKKETNKTNVHLNGGPKYSKEFEEWWEVYLRKDGKIGAFRVYKTAKKKGATKEMLLMAALCYSNRCKKDDTPVKYIMLPSTFLGRDMHWLEWYRNAEQIRQADEMRKIKDPEVVREQILLTPEQQKKNQEAISEILKPLKVKFGSRRV